MKKRQCNVWLLAVLLTPSFQLVCMEKEKIEERFLEAAAIGNRDAVVQYLNDGGNIDVCNENGETALYRAVKNRHSQTVSELIKRGADPSFEHEDWRRRIYPLDEAIWNGDWDTVLLFDIANEKGNLLTQWRREGCSCLHMACGVYKDRILPSLDAVKLLIKRGACVNLPTDKDKTPLCYAIESKSYPIAEYLLDHGADSRHNSVFRAASEASTIWFMNLIISKAKKTIKFSKKKKKEEHVSDCIDSDTDAAEESPKKDVQDVPILTESISPIPSPL